MEKKSSLKQENCIDSGLTFRNSINFNTHPLLHLAELIPTNTSPYLNRMYSQGMREGLKHSGMGSITDRVLEANELKETESYRENPYDSGKLNGLLIGIAYLTKTDCEIIPGLDSFHTA